MITIMFSSTVEPRFYGPRFYVFSRFYVLVAADQIELYVVKVFQFYVFSRFYNIFAADQVQRKNEVSLYLCYTISKYIL